MQVAIAAEEGVGGLHGERQVAVGAQVEALAGGAAGLQGQRRVATAGDVDDGQADGGFVAAQRQPRRQQRPA